MEGSTYIVRGQRVAREKVERAKQFRREMTPAERVLWAQLRTNKLPGLHFRRQQVIDGFIVDFYCHGARLVVEVDGAVHNDTAETDAERARILTARDLHILRIPNDDVVNDLPGVLARIMVCARRRSPRGGRQ